MSVSLVWYLLKHDHGRRLPVLTLWTACGFGVLAVVLAFILSAFLLPQQFATTPNSLPITKLLPYSLLVGVIEESAKFIPLAVFVYHRKYFKEHTDGIIYFAICGLTFGLIENILYTVQFGAGVGLGRMLLTPFFHAATTAIIGYYLVSMKITQNKIKFIISFLLIIIMHGLYDFGLMSQIDILSVASIMITLLLTMGIFLYFMQANDLDKADRSNNANYCTSCGLANTTHNNFCEKCGQMLQFNHIKLKEKQKYYDMPKLQSRG